MEKFLITKGQQLERQMPPGQSGSQLPAEQSGIGAGYDQVVPPAVEFVDEALPMREILDLIKKEVFGLAINGFDRLEQFIAAYLAAQRIVFKIEVGKSSAGKRLKGKRRFARPSWPDDDLRKARGERFSNGVDELARHHLAL